MIISITSVIEMYRENEAVRDDLNINKIKIFGRIIQKNLCNTAVINRK